MHHSISSAGVVIEFDAKPPAPVLKCLKAHGFRWNPRSKQWWRRRVTGAADVLAGIDKLTAPRKPDGPCWKCGNPNGYFRARGAATPVLCAECAKPLTAREQEPVR